MLRQKLFISRQRNKPNPAIKSKRFMLKNVFVNINSSMHTDCESEPKLSNHGIIDQVFKCVNNNETIKNTAATVKDAKNTIDNILNLGVDSTVDAITEKTLNILRKAEVKFKNENVKDVNLTISFSVGTINIEFQKMINKSNA